MRSDLGIPLRLVQVVAFGCISAQCAASECGLSEYLTAAGLGGWSRTKPYQMSAKCPEPPLSES